MTTTITPEALRALIEDGKRWQKVRASSVCGGSDAQAINVFGESLATIAKLTAALEAQADQIARLKAENATLREAVNKAAGWFEECAKSHRARGQLVFAARALGFAFILRGLTDRAALQGGGDE